MEDRYNRDLRIKLNLSFFDGEKTEQPTGKKLKDARSEGQVAKSQEVATAFLFLASFSALKMLSGYISTKLETIMYESINLVQYYTLFKNENPQDRLYSKMFTHFAVQVLMIIMPILFIVMAAGIISNIIQVGWHPTGKVLKPKFSKLNPLQGFKRLFSSTAIVELLKSIIKLILIGSIVYNVLSKQVRILVEIPFMDIRESIAFFADLAYTLGMTVGFAYLGIALADYVFQKYKHIKGLKMSKQEIKDEYKQSEGDPQVKGKIRQRMREASMRRMMQDIPSADVIITNPTHFAVAIRYKHNQDFAPIVVAKGVDHVAKKIREAGTENGIEIVENRPLARALYASVEIGEPIPPELYQSVAEILAFVYKLKNNI